MVFYSFLMGAFVALKILGHFEFYLVSLKPEHSVNCNQITGSLKTQIKIQGSLSIHFSVFLFGMAGLFGKWLLLSPELIVFGRVFFAAITLFIVLKIQNKPLKILNADDTGAFILNGLLLAIHWFAFFKSIQLSSVAIGLLTYSTFPVFVAVLEPFFFKEKFRVSRIILSALAVTGVYILIPDFNVNNQLTVAVFWGVLSGLSFAIISLINRRMVTKYSGVLVSFYLDLFACLFLVPLLFFQPVMPSVSEWGLLLILGVVFTALAHTLFVNGLKTVSASLASLIASLEPVYGILLAVLFLSEIPQINEIAGALLIVGSLVLGSLRIKLFK